MLLEAALVYVFLQYASQLSGIPITRPGYIPLAYTTHLPCVRNVRCIWGQTNQETLAVMLYEEFDRSKAWDHCVLVHELVHVLQAERDGIQPVTAEMEAPAYAAQAKCLRAYHLDKDAAQIEYRVKYHIDMIFVITP